MPVSSGLYQTVLCRGVLALIVRIPVVLAVRFLPAVRNIPHREAYKGDLGALLLRSHLILNPVDLAIRSPYLAAESWLKADDFSRCMPEPMLQKYLLGFQAVRTEFHEKQEKRSETF